MIKRLFLFLAISIVTISCKDTRDINLTEAETEANKVTASVDTYAKDNYTKKEVMIEMRDGIKLHTTIYSPKDTSKTYPMLMMRTPYSCRPYGEDYVIIDNSGDWNDGLEYYCGERSTMPFIIEIKNTKVNYSGDHEGNIFEWKNYESQDWAVENASIETYRDGTLIPQITDATEWSNLTTGAWCYINNDSTKGKVYNWFAIAGIHDNDETTPDKEFAPAGWRVPNDADWTTLENFLITNGFNYDGSNTGEKLAKAMTSKTGWNNSSTVGAPGNDQDTNNSSGFNAFPLGLRQEYGAFNFIGRSAVFWTSTEIDSDFALDRDIYFQKN